MIPSCVLSHTEHPNSDEVRSKSIINVDYLYSRLDNETILQIEKLGTTQTCICGEKHDFGGMNSRMNYLSEKQQQSCRDRTGSAAVRYTE